MPRKICKEKNVSSKRKHREGKSRFKHSRKYSDIPASIDIGVKNVKRWNALKVVCSFETDAEFAEYLLRLAENKIRKIPHKHENNENEKSLDSAEKDEGHKKKVESLQHNSVRFKTKRHRKEHKNSHHSRSHKKRHSTEKNRSSHKIDKCSVVAVSKNPGDKCEIDENCELDVKLETLEIPNSEIKSSEENKISVETTDQNNSGSVDSNALNSSRCGTSCNEVSSDQKCTKELDDIHHQTVPNLVIEKLDLSKINVQNYFQNKLKNENSVDISKCANITQPLLENNILSDNCNLSNIETVELKTSNKTKKPNQDDAIEYDNIKDEEVVTEKINITNGVIKRKRKKEKHNNDSKHKKKIKNHDIRKAPQLEFNSGDALNDIIKQEDEIDVDEPKENHENNPSVRVAIKIKLCYGCNTRHLQDTCPLQNPLRIIDDDITLDAWNKSNGNIDIKTENSCDDSESQKSFAVQSLPSKLYLEEVDEQHGLGVFSKGNIEKFTRFGPLIGKSVKEVDIPDDFNMKHIWEIRADNYHMYVNTENTNNSNWIRYIRPAETRDKRVLTGVIVAKELYFITIENITVGEELRYWIDEPQSVNRRKSEKTNCGGCNLVFEHTLYYRTHCSVFHDSRYSLTIRKYHCKVCGQAVLGKDNIVRHAAELHNGQGAYQCQFCKKFFLRLNYLEMHRTYGCAANPHRSRPLCDFCGQKFCQPQKLKVHIKRMHSDISLSEFQCPLCLKLLGSRAAVQRHAREVHRGTGLSGNSIPSNRASANNGSALACMRCGKLFQNKSNLKIHMLTHSGVKPFKCKEENCTAAFTTKQCLQFHYKKVHGFAEDFMPTIERSVEYTFAAYSGGIATEEEVTAIPTDTVPKQEPQVTLTRKKSAPMFDEINNGIDGDEMSSEDKNHDEPPALHSPIPLTSDQSSQSNQTPPTLEACVTIGNVKSSVVSKGSKKWLGNSQDNEQPTHILQQSEQMEQSRQMEQTQQDIYSFEEDRKPNDKPSSVVLDVDDSPENNRTKFNMCLNVYSSRHDSSNASLLVEAALDSVSDIHITTESNQTCSDGLVVSNLYPLTQHDNLTDVNYNQNDLSSSERDINLISPSVNDHISVTDHDNHVDYSSLQHDEFSTPGSPSLPSHLIHEYARHDETRPSVDIAHQSRNNYSLGGEQTQANDHSPSHSPPRYDFSQPLNTDTISNDSDGVVAQNLTINAKDKERLELDFSCYKSHYNDIDTTDLSIRKYDSLRNKFDIDTDDRDNYDITIDVTDDRNVELRTKQFSSDNAVQIIDPYSEVSDISDLKNKQMEQENDLRSKNYDVLDSDTLRALKYDLDSKYELEIRNKSYDALEADDLRSKTLYESNLDIELRTNKSYNLLDNELRNKAYDALLESEFRTDRAFEPLILNPTELQGLDMSARSYHGFHSGTTVPRYHIYSEPERESVPYASSADVLRVVSLDLTSQTRHGLHGLHAQLPNTRLLSDHSALQHNLTTNRLLTADHNRLSLDQTPRLLSSEHNLSVALLGSESRLLSDHTANRILSNDQLSEPRLVSPDAHRILSESSRLPNRGYSGYSMSPASYHPPTISSRSHIGSPTHNPSYHHYSGYY